ncbi:hypothetical protein BB561_003368 [Smittium simulii]|uniref:30S ribosomal protein S13 n=1 Tax=Smittium simulii TaxID=133385 RepID=A0A2T9YLT7_9FUNG|nr:hypothetical protein BB561_003368 [Smittium simulii]
MLFLLGTNLPDSKIVSIALTSFFGIGKVVSEKICSKMSIHKTCRLQDLSEPQINELTAVLSTMTIGKDLQRKFEADIKRLMRINCYIGTRHKLHLPVHGQRTRNNAKTAKKLNGRFVWNSTRQSPSLAAATR